MSMPYSEIELAISDRIGRPIRVTAAASECLNGLARELPLPSWELWLLNKLLGVAPKARTQCHLLAGYRYHDLLAIFEGKNKFVDYDWPESAAQPTVEEVQEGPDLQATLLWRLRLPQPESLEGVLDMLLGERPTGGVTVIQMGAEPVPIAESVAAVFGLDDLLYLLFRTLYSGSRISDTGIALLILGGRSQSEMHLGKYNRWFLDGFEGMVFDTGDPPAQDNDAK
jgi:hypothetical protein